MGEGPTPGTIRRVLAKAALPTAIVLVVIVQLMLLKYFEPPRILLSDTPASRGDLDTHVEQTWRVTESLDGWGKSWGYDVQLLAGYPNGTIFDADNKGWELWTFALWKMGLSRGLAFNLFIVLSHLMVPWVVFASARMFRLSWWGSLGAGVLAMSLWYFDIFPHRCWWIGMVAYAIVGYFYLLPLGLMYRYVQDGGWWRAVLLGLTMAAGHLVHPYIFMMLVAPMAVMYLRRVRTMKWQTHVGVVGAAVFTIAANGYWLIVAFQFWHYILDSGFFGQSDLTYLLSDYLGVMRDPDVTGYVANKTGFRILAMGAAVAGFVLWHRRKDDRFLPLIVGFGLMMAITYLGSYLWIMRQVQPYRHLLPAIFIAVIPAAAAMEELVRSGVLARMSRKVMALVIVVVIVALPHLVRDVFYFIPDLLPEIPTIGEQPVTIEERLGITAVAPIRKKELRRAQPHAGFDEIATWLKRNDDKQGRILVEWGFLGEHLAWSTDSQILGGFIWRNLEHSSANLFRRHREVDISDDELEKYLETYAVRWIIVSHRTPNLEDRKHMLREIYWHPPHRVYSPDTEVSFFAENSGHVEASLNLLKVTGTVPDKDVVLRYHYLETLLCQPDCTMQREEIEHDKVGFIRVPAPHPADFEIVNGY